MTPRTIMSTRLGDRLPELRRTPDIVQSFQYNAVFFNAHRIHFEQEYATQAEGYRALVAPGPLLGDWLGQCAEAWLQGGGRLVKLQYSNRSAAYVDEEIVIGGTVTAIDPDIREVTLELWAKNLGGELLVPGMARVRLIA